MIRLTHAARATCIAAALLAASAAVVFGVAGCTSRDSAQTPPRFAASRSVSAHGLSVSVFVSQQQLGIADRLTVLIEARQEAGTTGRAVPWPSSLAEAEAGKVFPPNPEDPSASQWTILECTRRTLAPGHETIELVLEPYLGGDKPIPVFEFPLAAGTLKTEPIPVTVISEHKLAEASPAAGDPLAALSTLGPALAPLPPRRPLTEQPLTWGILGALGVLVLAGGGAIIAVRVARRRSFSADEHLDRLLLQGREALAFPDTQHVDEVAAQTVGAFRTWLCVTRRVSPGTSGRELAAWIRATGLPSATQLADRLTSFEGSRFAPSSKIELSDARGLVAGVHEFTGELRAAAVATNAATEGGRTGSC